MLQFVDLGGSGGGTKTLSGDVTFAVKTPGFSQRSHFPSESGLLLTKDDSVTKAREEPTSPTVVSDLTAVTTEQPKPGPGHFESVPSIPSDLYD